LTLSKEDSGLKILISFFHFEGTLQQEMNHGGAVSKKATSTIVVLNTVVTESKTVSGLNLPILLAILVGNYVKNGKKREHIVATYLVF